VQLFGKCFVLLYGTRLHVYREGTLNAASLYGAIKQTAAINVAGTLFQCTYWFSERPNILVDQKYVFCQIFNFVAINGLIMYGFASG
jgi:hypothetical protein